MQLKAFTLIELIIVVVLCGIVALFAIPNYNKSVMRSNERAAMNNLLLVYGAQWVRFNSGFNNFVPPTGAPITLANINSQLSLSIMDTGTVYQCANGTSATNSTFECTAVVGASP